MRADAPDGVIAAYQREDRAESASGRRASQVPPPYVWAYAGRMELMRHFWDAWP